MFLGNVSSWTSVIGTDVPFTTVLNSNRKLTNNSGTISVNQSGYYNVDASLSLGAPSGATSATTATVSIYADGVQRPVPVQTVSIPASGIQNVSLVDVIRAVKAQYPSLGTISVRVGTAGVVVSGDIRITYVA